MKAESASLRQLVVLTSVGLLAPVVDFLPGALARQAGTAGWSTLLLTLPLTLLWVALLCALLRGEGSSLQGLVRRHLGRVGYGVFFVLYNVWAALVLARRLDGAAGRLERVYSPAMGALLVLLLLGLALWLCRGTLGALCRAGQMVWLGLLVTAVGVLLLAVPKVEWSRLLPENGWDGALGGVALGMEWVSAAAFGGVLMGAVPRKQGGHRMVLRWTLGIGLLGSALLMVVYGHMGADLAARLEEPFFIMVQGLSVRGGFARLEALVAALWLGADWIGFALPLYAVKTLAGERWGGWMTLVVTTAGVLGWLFSLVEGEIGFGLALGIGLPVLLWLLERRKTKK